MKVSKTHMLFPTPVFECKINDYKKLNFELAKYINELRKKDNKGLKASNAGGGWHSPFFLISETDVIKKFATKIYPFIYEIATEHYSWNCTPDKIKITGMWSVINKKNSYNVRHFHPNCNLSAAYYVKAKKNCGKIKFFDPTDQKAMQSPFKKKLNILSSEVADFTPEEGDLLIFPSYLHHSVEQNLSEDERIVISFNIKII
ncbi:TIGR02466 family protein [Candidatus Pelagibacter sp.]|nr:TIGR02466 family protein [Candidatus Pelagibacter sp.]